MEKCGTASATVEWDRPRLPLAVPPDDPVSPADVPVALGWHTCMRTATNRSPAGGTAVAPAASWAVALVLTAITVIWLIPPNSANRLSWTGVPIASTWGLVEACQARTPT